MKCSYHATLSFLCFMLAITETAASWNFGFVFDNLLFMIGAKKDPNCNSHHGPLPIPKMCSIACPIDSRRILDEVDSGDNSRCSDKYTGNSLKACQKIVCDDSARTDYESANNAYNDNSSSSSNDSISTGTTSSSRMGFLPYMIAAVVATMFLGLFVWKKRREQNSQQQQELLADDDSFHGSIAKRISNFKSGKMNTSVGEGTETSFVKSAGYALA